MKEVFVDSFFWLAVMNPRDAYHEPAIAAPQPARGVTTRAVQLEVMDACSAPQFRKLAAHFWQETNADPSLSVIPLDDDLLHRAAALFEGRTDKYWSMTDCISFVVMQDRGISDALTGDHHFEQAGFRALLKDG